MASDQGAHPDLGTLRISRRLYVSPSCGSSGGTELSHYMGARSQLWTMPFLSQRTGSCGSRTAYSAHESSDPSWKIRNRVRSLFACHAPRDHIKSNPHYTVVIAIPAYCFFRRPLRGRPLWLQRPRLRVVPRRAKRRHSRPLAAI